MNEIIPVIDLMNSVAVSGKSGNRSEYTPLKTIYASSANPVEIASSLKLAGAKEMYIADLNFIERDGSHNINEINDVNRILPVIADIGVDNLNTFEFALKYAYKIIVATETLESIDELMKIFEKYPKERIIVRKKNTLCHCNFKFFFFCWCFIIAIIHHTVSVGYQIL